MVIVPGEDLGRPSSQDPFTLVECGERSAQVEQLRPCRGRVARWEPASQDRPLAVVAERVEVGRTLRRLDSQRRPPVIEEDPTATIEQEPSRWPTFEMIGDVLARLEVAHCQAS